MTAHKLDEVSTNYVRLHLTPRLWTLNMKQSGIGGLVGMLPGSWKPLGLVLRSLSGQGCLSCTSHGIAIMMRIYISQHAYTWITKINRRTMKWLVNLFLLQGSAFSSPNTEVASGAGDELKKLAAEEAKATVIRHAVHASCTHIP